ncbi:hypothetical protein MTO96_016699 [Rhipicephalus appendiculatus]
MLPSSLWIFLSNAFESLAWVHITPLDGRVSRKSQRPSSESPEPLGEHRVREVLPLPDATVTVVSHDAVPMDGMRTDAIVSLCDQERGSCHKKREAQWALLFESGAEYSSTQRKLWCSRVKTVEKNDTRGDASGV